MKLGRNDPCHCGSGKKYKKCCYAKDTAKTEAANGGVAAEVDAEKTEDAAAGASASDNAAQGSGKSGKTGHGGKREKQHQHGKSGNHPLSPRVFRGAQRGN